MDSILPEMAEILNSASFLPLQGKDQCAGEYSVPGTRHLMTSSILAM
jgi:hypothetical protein